MTGTNGFLPFAYGSGANVLSDADYASALSNDGQYATGVVQGRASSQQANKTWLQGTLMASVLGQIIANMGQSASDSQSVNTLSQNLVAAFRRSSLVLPYDSTFAALVGGYPSKSIVADASNLGVYWISTADDNLTTPGASGSSWQNLFAEQAPLDSPDFIGVPTAPTALVGDDSEQIANTSFVMGINGGRYLNTRVITSSQTYTVPAGVYKIRVRLQAAGGAAGGSADNTGGNGSSCASSGGAGAYLEAIFAVTPGQQIPISIGVGGVGVTGKAGGTGGATTFGPFGSFATLSCPGGLGGYAGTQTSATAAASIPGCPGNGLPSGPNIVYAVAAAGGLPGIAVLGTAAAPPGSNSPMGAGGSGITGYNGSTSQPGGNAGGWGGGGGAHANQQAAQNAGGAGGNGVCIIDEFSA